MNPLVATEARSTAQRTALSVNINKIALLRNTRAIGIPDPVRFAAIALDAGAQGITVHPRPDARHIRQADVAACAALVQSRLGAEFNIEGNPFHNLMDLVREFRPHQCTFVPDSVDQSTSDHGWDLIGDRERLKPLIAEARSLGVRVSLFMDPEPEAMAIAAAIGADRVELYTEHYARMHGSPTQAEVVDRYAQAAASAAAAGLGVNAGHDLNRDNLADFLGKVAPVAEVSIGHALIADAIELGLARTVEAYLRCIHDAGR